MFLDSGKQGKAGRGGLCAVQGGIEFFWGLHPFLVFGYVYKAPR